MSARASTLLLIGVMIASCAGAQAQYDNIKDMISRAAGDFAASVGTSISTGALASGICLERTDQTSNSITCQSQPSSELHAACYSTLSIAPGQLISCVSVAVVAEL